MVETIYEDFFSKDWKKAYGVWHRIIDRGGHQIDLIKKAVQEIVSSEIKILDLGCGEGDELNEALSSFKDKKFKVTANDSSREALEMYKIINSDYLEESHECRLEKVPSRLTSKFDLILFSHCLYQVDLNNLFENYLKLLNPGGKILVFLESEESQLLKIRKEFWKKVHNKEFDEVTPEKITNLLDKSGIPYEFFRISYNTNLKKLEELKEAGLRDFYIPFVFRTEEFPPEIFAQIEKRLLKIIKEGLLKTKTGVIIIKNES